MTEDDFRIHARSLELENTQIRACLAAALLDSDRLEYLIKNARREESQKWIEFGFPCGIDPRSAIDFDRKRFAPDLGA